MRWGAGPRKSFDQNRSSSVSAGKYMLISMPQVTSSISGVFQAMTASCGLIRVPTITISPLAVKSVFHMRRILSWLKNLKATGDF